MSYDEFEPDITLQPDIKCFWWLEEHPQTYNADTIVPDSYVELVINCGAPLFYVADNGTRLELPRVMLKGLQKTPLRLHVTALSQLIGVRLHPWIVQSLLGIEMHKSDIPLTPLADVWQQLAHLLPMALRTGGPAEAVATLQQFISDHRHNIHPDVSAIRAAGDLMVATQGHMRMHEIAQQCAVSHSQFERHFKQLTGISPKTFARLVRFEAIRDSLTRMPTLSLVDLAYRYGYTDQAHFIHDFKAFAGRTPGAFATQVIAQQNAEFLQSS
jgi:AraC-like DNA-binding protein